MGPLRSVSESSSSGSVAPITSPTGPNGECPTLAAVAPASTWPATSRCNPAASGLEVRASTNTPASLATADVIAPFSEANPR